jgi:probable rRNA maturation factor
VNDPAQRLDLVFLNPNRYPEAAVRSLRPWVAAVVTALAPGAESLGVRFVSDREMRRVNRRFRGKDETTDVLTFPGGDGHLGDLLVSVPTARRQAAAAGHGAARELRTLLLHGVLHCLGYDHEADEGEMDRLERRLRRTWIGGDGHD